MKVKAAVLYEANKPLVVETVDLDEPKDSEVLVRMVSAGVCYSDYHIMKGEWTMPLPMVGSTWRTAPAWVFPVFPVWPSDITNLRSDFGEPASGGITDAREGELNGVSRKFQ